MDNEWKNAKLKLEKLFADDGMRGTIKGQLLRIDMKNRLEYFEGSDKEVKASLSTLLLGKVKTFLWSLKRVIIDKYFF